ncbi:enoyl-CoA hydratase-related protein [Caballeronia sp. AZ7_KS35]|uniref:enoyl-CoA hydratase-related protein n=1 Tax=Caballeronia sp. AZ7_KS35 TaxID=2921762 RepID=UPI0020292779|nr:enoyl-CoA hydratase-related protein [Caballeronia sp. AZ7_KS35]
MKASALLGGLGILPVSGSAQQRQTSNKMNNATLGDIPLSSAATVTIERRDTVAFIGINRPDSQDRIDPQTYLALAQALYRFDNNRSLRAAILFGHGANFSRGIDVAAFAPVIASGRPFLLNRNMRRTIRWKRHRPFGSPSR